MNILILYQLLKFYYRLLLINLLPMLLHICLHLYLTYLKNHEYLMYPKNLRYLKNLMNHLSLMNRLNLMNHLCH